jgi:hypothetical protein
LTNDNEKLSSENQVYAIKHIFKNVDSILINNIFLFSSFSQQFILLQTELQEAMGDKRRLDMRLSHLQQELMVILLSRES